jgi:hypothetical protein
MYTTEQYETWLGDDNLLKQLKIIKTWNEDGTLNNVLEVEQTPEEIQAYLDKIKLEQQITTN